MAGWGYGWGNQPNFNLFIEQSWAPGGALGGGWEFGNASNVVVGCNPPYSANDFLSFYPQFGGAPLILSGMITSGSPVVTGISTTAGILPGQTISTTIPMGGNQFTASPFPDNTLVKSVDSASQLTLTQAATMTASALAIYNATWIPVAVLNAYIFLASASLVQARWCEMWQVAMSLFINHWCTLYLRSSGDPVTSAGQLASQGLARGVLISKAAGGVSVGIQPSTSGGGLEDWGSWQSTEAGVSFCTMARVIGAGPMWLY